MSLQQFRKSIDIIMRNEHCNRSLALGRHFFWQVRKKIAVLPVRRKLSRSVLLDDEPGGVVCMVNMLGLYDFNNMHFVQSVLRSNFVFVDVGANIGPYTLLASENSSIRVISLEPNPTAFVKLQRNIALNSRINVEALNLAVSHSPGTARMTNYGSHTQNRIIDNEGAGLRTIQVAVETLDRLCQTKKVEPTLIKIDVEGHEPEVLAGARSCLECSLACIVENGEDVRVREIMWSAGWRGPYYYQHRFQRLERTPQRLKEDPIFIGKMFEASGLGICVTD